MSAVLARFRGWGRRAPETEEAPGLLTLTVSDAGWRATMTGDGEEAPLPEGEGAGLEGAPVALSEMLRRAVRALPSARRAAVGSVRLLVAEPEAAVADNRSVKLRTDAAGLREAGGRMVPGGGAHGALHGFLPFGRSSQHEAPRGAHLFVSVARGSEWLGALEGLAVRLVRLVPAEAVLLGAPGEGPFAAVGLHAGATSVLMADPESGAVACRRVPVGLRHLAAAVAEATSVGPRDALAGLARRDCLPPSEDPGRASTATEAALAPGLSALREALLETAEYFAYQRLAGSPAVVRAYGEAGRVRGLAAWLGAVLEAPAEPLDLHARMLAGDGDGANLLESAPPGLLRIGRVDHPFRDGRFRPEREEAAGGGLSLPELLRRPVSLAMLRDLAALAPGRARALAAPAAGAALVSAGLWAASPPDPGTDRAGAAAMLGEASEARRSAGLALGRALAAPPPEIGAADLPWTARLLALSRAAPPGLVVTRLASVPEGAGRNRLVIEGALPAAPDAAERVAAFLAALSADPAFAPRGPALEAAVREGATLRFAAAAALGPAVVRAGSGREEGAP